MTKEEALYSFYSQFGTAYEEVLLPKNATYPYLTYSVATGSFGDGDIPQSLSVWTRSTAWTQANTIAKQISDALNPGGKQIEYDGGVVWLKGGTIAQEMGDESDDLVKRKVIVNLTAEYI